MLITGSKTVSTQDKIREMDIEMGRKSQRDVVANRLVSILGVGPILAMALEASLLPARCFHAVQICLRPMAFDAAAFAWRQAQQGEAPVQGPMHA